MDLNFLSPYIRVAMDSIIDSPIFIQERVIFDYELFYLKEGSVFITIEDQGFYANPGDIFLFKPKQRHSIKVLSQGFRQPHIHFDLFYQPDSPEVRISFKPLEQIPHEDIVKFRKDITGKDDLDLPNKIFVSNIKYFEKLLFDVIEEFEAKKPFSEINAKGLFIKLWVYILQENYWNNNPMVFSNIDTLKKIKDYISVHIKEEITMNELAYKFNISKYYMIRSFKKVYSITPIHFHKLIRIEKAKEMIQFTDLSFTEISEITGFKSINAFSRAFRQMEGVPPSFYRNKNA